MSRPASNQRLLGFALATALLAIVVGLYWAAFGRYGSDMPNWDQWDAEAVNAIGPWYAHDHFVQHLLSPHNEHRVVLTKLQNLAVTLACGQWDARAQALLNAILYGAIAIGLWSLARRHLAGIWHAPVFVVLAALFGLPLSEQNLLSSFHSQQYWLVALSMAALCLLPLSAPWSSGWWAGLLAAVLVLGSMGSGYLAAAVTLILVLWWLIRRQAPLRAVWPTVLVTTLIIVFGEATRVEVSGHAELKARTVHDFVLTIVRSLAWPWYGPDWTGAILWAPWFGLTAWALWSGFGRRSSQEPATRGGWIIVALGGWVLAQILATAYARGAGAGYPASRYLTTLVFGCGVNALALFWLLSQRASVSRQPEPRRRRHFILVAKLVGTSAWLITFGTGLSKLAYHVATDSLPNSATYYVEASDHLRAYLFTNDPAELTEPIPYLTPESLIARLDIPPVRSLMPAGVRPALPLTSPASEAFLRNSATPRTLATAPHAGLTPGTPPLASRPTWGSFNAAGATNMGEWQSGPVVAAIPGWLRFEVAGDLGPPGLTLELRDAATGVPLAAVNPPHPGKPAWQTVYVRTPRKPFVIFARDADAQRSFAFSAPVEVSTFSYIALRLMKHGLWIAGAGAGASVLIGLLMAVNRGRPRPARFIPPDRPAKGSLS